MDWVKKIRRNTLAQDGSEHTLDGVTYTDQNISARSLTFLIFAVECVGIVWWTTTRTRVSDATAVIFSVKCFNPLKLYPLSGNVFRKWFASHFFLFICEHLIIMWSPVVTLVALTTFLLTSGLHRCYKKYLRRIQNIFMPLESTFRWLYCLKYSFKNWLLF